MELGGSLPHSQQPTTYPYPNQINPFLCLSHFWQAQLVSFLVGLRTYQSGSKQTMRLTVVRTTRWGYAITPFTRSSCPTRQLNKEFHSLNPITSLSTAVFAGRVVRFQKKRERKNFLPSFLTYLLTYLLTAWCRVLIEELTGLQLVNKFPAFHRTRKFITALTSVRHLSLSWPTPIQSIYPLYTSWRSILILSTHLRLGLPSGLFPSGFPTKTLYTPLSSPIRATCPAHLILLDFITRTVLGEEYKSFSSSLYNLLHSPVTSSLLGPNILLNTMFWNTLSFLSSRNVSDQKKTNFCILNSLIWIGTDVPSLWGTKIFLILFLWAEFYIYFPL